MCKWGVASFMCMTVLKNIEVRVAFLETIHTLFQAISYKLKIFRAIARIFHSADLHNVLIKTFSFVGSSADIVARFHAEKMFIITAVNFSVIAFLSDIVTLR